MRGILDNCITWQLMAMAGGVPIALNCSDQPQKYCIMSDMFMEGSMLWHVNRAGPIKRLMDEAREG